jgi:hypothetical protein
MSRESYQNPHARHEGELADTYYRETVEVLYGPEEQPNTRGGCLIVVAVLVATVVLGWWLL